MDLRVLVLIADQDLGELIREQVENPGCSCSLATTYDEGSTALGWAEAAIVDLAGDGLDDLYRLRVEAPTVRILAIAPDAGRAERARAAGVDHVLVEPFSVADLGDAVRAMDRGADSEAVDLPAGERTAAPAATPAVDDAPWWATR